MSSKQTTLRLAGVCTLVALCVAARPPAGGFEADTPDGRTFTGGSLKLETAPWLTATQGLIDVECRLPEI